MKKIFSLFKKIFSAYAVKAIALSAVGAFMLTSVCQQAIGAVIENIRQDVQTQKVFSDFDIPSSYGKITYADFLASDTVIINIQDLHAHPQVQKNIAQIIETLDKKYGVSGIYLEGGYGQIDTSWLSALGKSDERKTVLDNMLSLGYLTGAEYYSALSGRNNLIQGLERKNDYLNNLKRFSQILEFQEKTAVLLKEASDHIETVKSAYYNKEQKRLYQARLKYADNKLKPEKYYELLYEYADKANLDAEQYENMAYYKALLECGKNIKSKNLAKEVNSLIVSLRSVLPYGVYSSLSKNTENFSQPDKLLYYLAKIAPEYNLNLSVYPSLNKLFNRVLLSQKINPIELVDEEERFFDEINESYYYGKSAQEAAFLVNFQRRLKALLSAKITAQDFKYYLQNRDLFKTLWAKYIGNGVLSKLEEYEQTAIAFYAVNEKRNLYFLNNIGAFKDCGKIQERGFISEDETANVLNSLNYAKKIYITITGGYHTKALSMDFSKNGISNIIITPNVLDDIQIENNAYIKIVKEQSSALFNALAALPLSLSPEEIKIAVLASSLNSIEDANEIIRLQIEKAKEQNANNGVLSASIEEYENGEKVFKIHTASKRVTFAYDKKRKEFINPAVYNVSSTQESSTRKSSTQESSTREFSTQESSTQASQTLLQKALTFLKKIVVKPSNSIKGLLLVIFLNIFSLGTLNAAFDYSHYDVLTNYANAKILNAQNNGSDSLNTISFQGELPSAAADTIKLAQPEITSIEEITESVEDAAAENAEEAEEIIKSVEDAEDTEDAIENAEGEETIKSVGDAEDTEDTIENAEGEETIKSVGDAEDTEDTVENAEGEETIKSVGDAAAPLGQAGSIAGHIRDINYSYPQLQNIAGLGEELLRQNAPESALTYGLNKLNAFNKYAHKLRQASYLFNSLDAVTGFEDILSGVNNILTVIETDAIRESVLELKETLNYELPDGDGWKDNFPQNNDLLFSLLASYGNDAQRALDHILFPSLYDENGIGAKLPANFYLSWPLRNDFLNGYRALKSSNPELTFENYWATIIEERETDILIDALKQYRSAKKARYYDYVKFAKNVVSLPYALSGYSSVPDLTLDLPLVGSGTETTLYIPGYSAVNKDGSPEKELAAQARTLRNAYSKEEVKNLAAALSQTENPSLFYSAQDKTDALNSAQKVLEEIILEETANQDLGIEQIPDNLEKHIIKKEFSPAADSLTSAKESVQKYKHDLYIGALEEKLKEKDGENGKRLLNSQAYFDEIKGLLSSFTGTIVFNYYKPEQYQKIFKDASDLLKNKDKYIGRLNLQALKTMAKENLKGKSKYFPKDSVLLKRLKNNSYDETKTFYEIVEETFFIEPAMSAFENEFKAVGWRWGLKKGGKALDWGKKPQTQNYSDRWTNPSAAPLSYQTVISNALKDVLEYLPQNYQISAAADFAMQYDFAQFNYAGSDSAVIAQMGLKYRQIILADAIAQESYKYETQKDSYSAAALEKIIQGAQSVNSQNYEQTNNELTQKISRGDSLSKDSYFNFAVTQSLDSLNMPKNFKLSNKTLKSVKSFLQANEFSSKEEASAALTREYAKTFYFDALFQYKNGHKLKIADWVPFAVSLLPQAGLTSKSDQEKTVQWSGWGYVGIAVLPDMPENFYLSFSLLNLSGHYGASQKIAQAFAKSHYLKEDAVRDYLLSNYILLKDSTNKVFSQDQEKELFDWINKKEKQLVKEAIRDSITRRYGQWEITKLSKGLEKKMTDGYNFVSASVRQKNVENLLTSRSSDIELYVLSNLLRQYKNAVGRNVSANQDKEKEQKISELARQDEIFNKIRELSQKLKSAPSEFAFYGSSYVQKTLKSAETLISETQNSQARINAALVEVLSKDLNAYLGNFKEYVLPADLHYQIKAYLIQTDSLNLSQERLSELITENFAKDILLNALEQYRQLRALQFGEYFVPILKTALKLTPAKNISGAFFFIAETADAGKSVERKFLDNLKAAGYESYDDLKNVLLSGIEQYSNVPYRVYSAKDENKIKKWIENNEKKLIIKHFNDKLLLDAGVSKLSSKTLEKKLFKDYAYNYLGDKRLAVFDIFKNNAQEIAADALKQKPQYADKINAAKQKWLSGIFSADGYLAALLPDEENAPVLSQTPAQAAAQEQDGKNSGLYPLILSQNDLRNALFNKKGKPASSAGSRWTELTGYLELVYYNPDYGLYLAYNDKTMFWFSIDENGKIKPEINRKAYFDANLNVQKAAEKIIKGGKTNVSAQTHIDNTANYLQNIPGVTDVQFNEDEESGGYFTFTYLYGGHVLDNYAVLPFINGKILDLKAGQKAEIVINSFKWLIDKGYSPKYVDNPTAERSQYFLLSDNIFNNVKLYLYSPLGDRMLLRKNSLYFDLQRETAKEITLESYKDRIIQYYNQRGYGSDAAQALTLGKNISIEEYYIGNIRYWWLPDGTEIYPENYDGTLVPYDELILYSQYGGLEKAGLHGQIIQGKRIDLKDNSVFYYDAQGNFAGTKKKAGLTAYEISPVTEDGEFIDRQEFALAILNTGKIKKLQTDYQTAHPDSHFEDKYDEDGTWIINNIALTPQKDNGEVLTLAELEGLAAKTYQVTPEDILIAQAALADVKETAVSDEVSNSANQIAQPDDVSASQSNAALTANESAQAAAPKVESAPTTTNESASATAAAPTTTNESASAAAAAQAAAPEIESEQETTNEPAPAAEITDKLKEFYDNNKVLSFILAFLLIWLPIWIIAKKKNSSNKNGSDGRLKVSVFPVIEILRWMFQDIAELIINKKQNKQEPKEEQPSAIYLFTGGSYAQAYALQKQGLKTAVVERVYSAPAKHKKLTPRWPNSVVQIKRGRKTYEFTIEYYIPSAAQDSNKPLSIKALISNVSTRKGNDFSKLPRDAQTLLMRDAYILSHRQLAQNIEDDAKHLQKRLSANSVGAVFYKTFGANNGAQTPFLEVSENGREKYFYGSRETNNIEILLNDVLAAKEHFKSRSFKGHAYGVSLNAAKRKNLSDKKKTDKFISKTVSQNISILKVESENPAQVIEDLWKKRKTEDSVKFQNVLSSDASVQKILTLNSTDLNERLLRRIFALGFNGVYLKTQKDDIESSLDLVSSFSPQNARNFIELTSKEALDFQDAVKNANFVPAVKISKTKPDIAKALEGMENAAVIIDSFVSGDELAGAREKISAVFLKSAQSALKDKSDINALTKNKALKIYKAALEHAKKSPLTSQDITSPEILDAYAQEPQNDNFSQKDFDELKEALTAAGVPKESALAKYIESAPNDIFGFAASKAYLKAAIEKQRAKTAPVSKSAKIKSFFTQLFTIIPYKFKFPKVFASAARFNGVSSIEDLKNKISQLSKNNVVNLEFNLEVKENQIFVQIERTRSERTLLPLRQVLDAAANNRKAKILFNAAQINQDFSFFFEEASRYPANVSLITSDADLIVKYRQIYPDINFIFEINGVSDYETFKNIVSKNTKSVSLNKALYEIFKDSLSQEINSVLPEIFIKTNADEENYNAYLSDNKNEINLISDTPAESQKGYAKARAASGNIKSLPFLLLITQLDLFISFWTLFVENAGHSLALINTAVAIAAPFFILSTFAAKYLSSTIGQRNAVITYLTLQIAGSAILYFVGFSPAFVILYVVIPVFAQGGIQTLFTPFMQSALIAIDKLDKAESIDAKSRSFLWKGVGLGILSGGALAAAFGQPNVIILSTILLTAMLVYVLANSKTIERVQDIVEETQEMANGIKNKIKKYAAGFKAAFNNYVSDIKSLLKNKTLIQILVSTTLVEVLMTAVVPIEAPSIIVGIGFAVPAIAVIYFIGNMLQSFISEIAAKDNFAKLRSLIKNKTARSLYWASMSVVALAFAFTHNPVIFLAFFALIEIFLALSQTIESSYVAQNVDENKSESLYNVKLISDAALSALFTLMIARFGGDSSQDLSLLGKIIFAVTAVSFAATLAVSAAYIKFGKPSIFKKKTNRDYTYKILQSA